IDSWPKLRSPILVATLAGWVDAGEAGSGAATMRRAPLESARELGGYALTEVLDLQQTRPTVSLVDGTTRRIEWPSIELTAGHAGRDVVTCVGPEPSLRWPTFIDEMVD